MRKYCDLHLRPKDLTEENLTEVARLLNEFGFKVVGLTFPVSANAGKIERAKEIFKGFNVDLAPRADLRPKNREELLRLVRRLRRRFEVVGVECPSSQVAAVAARDRRVDIIYFPLTNLRVRFKHTTAHVSTSALEINLAELIPLKSRNSVIERVRSEVLIAKKNGIPIVISTGATSSLLIRAPREMAACGLLFNLKFPEALDSVSTIPVAIIERNRDKLSPSYVAEGIRVVKDAGGR
ncbi:TPA: hypothetical protein EYP26_02435 [Candidatus Bathyarchaeota archaeon]|nr:hypothetical protein [Candidatus Bathyarchaeota archaeon]